MTYSLQHKVFLASCYWAINFLNVCSNVNYTRQNYDTTIEKLAFECDKNFSGATTNIHQQNPYMTSGIIFVTIPYCTIYYLLCQEFFTVCVYS